ncbi:hypothetical protein KAU11_03205 [Candidatus Babeliales bacterium]|nr:hypothetical protein [Candidatus Babeliales bacterium]
MLNLDKSIGDGGMERAFERWCHIRAKYIARKPYFSKLVRKWEFSGWNTAARHVKELLKKTDILCCEIKREFEKDNVDSVLIERKIKYFASLYKDLSWSSTSMWRQWSRVGGAIAFVVLIATFIGWPRRVFAPAVISGLASGDIVWEDRLTAVRGKLTYGDVVSFHDSSCLCCNAKKQSLWGKFLNALELPGACPVQVGRVVAVAGDAVEGTLFHGDMRILVNGTVVQDTLLNQSNVICENGEVIVSNLAVQDDLFEEKAVPQSYCLVISDHNGHRFWESVDSSRIMGKIQRVLYSVKQSSKVVHPSLRDLCG